MTPEEAIKTIQVAVAEVEWEYALDYDIAFETAIEALKNVNHQCDNCGLCKEREEEAVKEFAENVTYCKYCKNYELMTSNNQHFCNRYGGYVKETDCCSRGTPCKNGR